MTKKVLDVIDAHVEGIIRRNPEAMKGLMDLVGRYQRGEVSDAEQEAALKEQAARAARRR